MPKHSSFARPLMLSAALLALPACGSNTTADETVASADPEATATATTAALGTEAVRLPLTAPAFVEAIAASNNFEIESARIVQASGAAQPLADFAQMMARDHHNSTEELAVASNAVSGTAIDDQKLTDEQKADLEALRAAAGREIAVLYKRQQIEAHQKALAMLQTYAASGDNQALMQFAAKAIPVVSRHLAEARQLP
jgi:putative membrane protein